MRFDVAALEFKGKTQLLLQLIHSSTGFQENAAPSMCQNAAHLQLIAAPTGPVVKRDVVVEGKPFQRRGERDNRVNLSEW